MVTSSGRMAQGGWSDGGAKPHPRPQGIDRRALATPGGRSIGLEAEGDGLVRPQNAGACACSLSPLAWAVEGKATGCARCDQPRSSGGVGTGGGCGTAEPGLDTRIVETPRSRLRHLKSL
jgi:hypothetical protein